MMTEAPGQVLTNPQDPYPIKIGSEYQVSTQVEKGDYQINVIYRKYAKDSETEESIKLAQKFSFTIGSDYDSESDLFVVLKAVEDQSTYPIMFVSQNKRLVGWRFIIKPISSSSFDDPDSIQCGFKGVDVCSIAPEVIKLDTTYYLSVFCTHNCKFTMKVQYQKEKLLDLDEGVILNFTSTESQLFKIRIPNDTIDIDRVIVRAHLLKGHQSANESFYFYVNAGNENPSAAIHDFQGEEIWSVGKGVVIHNATDGTPLSPGSNLTLIAISGKNTQLYLRSDYQQNVSYQDNLHCSSETRPIHVYEIVDDMVGPGETNYYLLTLEPHFYDLLENNSLSIDIHPYEGNPDLYITVPPRPDSLDDYDWQSQLDVGFESLTISAGHRDLSTTSDSQFMVAIKGTHETSSYSFYFYISDQFLRILSTISTESGFLTPGEHVSYQVFLPDEPRGDYTIRATFPQGKALLAVKKCIRDESVIINSLESYLRVVDEADTNNFFNCSFSHEDLLQIEQHQHNSHHNQIKLSDQLEFSEDTLTFTYDEQNCFLNQSSLFLLEDSSSKCKWVTTIIGVKNLNQDNHKIHYMLTLHGQKQHVELEESQPIKSYLMQYDEEYYRFRLSQEAEEVTFQLTVMNGDINAYASRTEQFPTQTNSEKQATMHLDLLKFRNPQDGSSLKGTYYITVKADSLSHYTINAVVFKKEPEQVKATTYIPLFEGIPQKMMLDQQVVYLNFRVQLGFVSGLMQGDEHDKSIFVHLNSINGTFDAYILAFDDQTPISAYRHPSPEDFFWSITTSGSRSLIIDEDDPHYVGNGTYFIEVTAKSPMSQFEILFTTERSIIPIRLGLPHYDVLEQNQLQFYELSYEPSHEELTIIISTDDGENSEQCLKTSYSTWEQYPSISLGTFENVFKLTRITLNSCDNIERQCLLHIALKAFCPLVEFSVLVRAKNAVAQLLDGVMQTLPAPLPSIHSQNDIHVYFRLPQSDFITVQCFSYFSSMEITANVVDYEYFLEKLKSLETTNTAESSSALHALFPSNTSSHFSQVNQNGYGLVHQYVSTQSRAGLLTLTKEQIATFNCSQSGCALLISVGINPSSFIYHYMMDENLTENDPYLQSLYSEDATFTLIASSQMSSLKHGSPVLGVANDGIMAYYKFVVPYPVKVIEIAVIPQSEGDPDLYVKFQNKKSTILPSIDIYDWVSVSYKTDVLIIQADSEVFQNQSNAGEYIIGVLGFQQCTYQLEVNFANLSIYTLENGIPFDKIAYFKFNNLYNSAFRVLIAPSAPVEIEMIKMKSIFASSSLELNKTIISYLPFQKNADLLTSWRIEPNERLFGNILYVPTTHLQFCVYCTYYIGLRTNISTKVGIVASTVQAPLTLVPSSTIYDFVNGTNLYIFSTQNHTCTIEITPFQGDITFYYKIDSQVSQETFDMKFQFNGSKKTRSIPIDAMSLAQDEKEHFVYILVAGNTANYSILGMHQMAERKLIQPGKSETGSLKANESLSFYLYPSHPNDIYTLQVHFQSSTPPNITITFVPDSSSESEQQVQFKLIRPASQFIQAPLKLQRDDGHYLLTLATQTTQEFILLLNQNSVNLLVPNQEFIAKQIVTSRTPDIYDIFVYEDSQLFLEIYQCIGKVFALFQDLEQPKADPLPNKVTYSTKKTGDVFFQLQSLDGKESEIEKEVESLFRMVPHVVPKELQEPQKIWFSSPNATTLSDNANTTTIKIKTLRCSQNDCKLGNQEPDSISYVLHISNSQEHLQAFVGCNLEIDYVKDYRLGQKKRKLFHEKYLRTYSYADHQSQEEISISLDRKSMEQATVYYVQVLVEVLYRELQTEAFGFVYEDYEFFYNYTLPQDVQTEKPHDVDPPKPSAPKEFERYKLYLIIGTCLLVLCAMIYGVYKCCTNKRKKSKKDKQFDEEEVQKVEKE